MPLSQNTSQRRNHTGYLCPYVFSRPTAVTTVKNLYSMTYSGGNRWIGHATITCPTGANLVDTDILTISDGRETKVFEFDSDTTVTTGRIGVTYAAGSTNAQVATAVAAAINAAFPTTLKAYTTAQTVYVYALKQGYQGATITETVAHASCVVSALSFNSSASQPMPCNLGGRPAFVAFNYYGT